jgi:type VI protein secretion system component Hcp
MAHTITLKVGTITGDSKGVADPKKKLSDAKIHVNEIDCLSWHWGITQTSKSSTGGGMSTAEVHDLTITKCVDSATPNLFVACHTAAKQVVSGESYQGQPVGAILTLFKNVDGTPVEFLVIKLLGTVIVSSVQTGDAGENDMYTETVTFNFSKAVMVHTKDDGKSAETPINIA